MPIGKRAEGSAVAEAQIPSVPKAEVNQTRVPLNVEYQTPRANKGRDFDAEARGKVACASYAAALASYGVGAVPSANLAEYLANVEKVADAMVAYTWEHQK